MSTAKLSHAERLAKTKLTKDHRFVLLQPCGHIVEAAFMDNYVNNMKPSSEHFWMFPAAIAVSSM
jgi:hypothetical protein